ncbi:MAG: hypothetical protein GTO14_02280 [Anaerolineales bacterium]|nr:hypothetical protein [Anaerolineales bacterium]
MPLETLRERSTRALGRILVGLRRATVIETSAELEVGQKIFGLYFYDTYHIGQTEYLRQLAGTNDGVV